MPSHLDEIIKEIEGIRSLHKESTMHPEPQLVRKHQAVKAAAELIQSMRISSNTNGYSLLGSFIKILIDRNDINSDFLSGLTWHEWVKVTRNRIGVGRPSEWTTLLTIYWPVKGVPDEPLFSELYHAGYTRQEIWDLAVENSKRFKVKGAGMARYVNFLEQWADHMVGVDKIKAKERRNKAKQFTIKPLKAADKAADAIGNRLNKGMDCIERGCSKINWSKATTATAWVLAGSAGSVILYRMLV